MIQAAVQPKKWFALAISVEPEAAEAVESAFNALDSLGSEIDYMPKDRKEMVTVVGYFNELPDDEALQDELHYALRAYGLTEDAVEVVEHLEIENQDWLLEWKKHWKPVSIGRFVIAPPWEDVDDAEKIVIRIEPNMAFGTGTHETTQLCLAAIDELYRPGDSFLDVGTGTGILAVAAAKMNTGQAREVFKCTALDTDPESVKIAAENAELNGVADQIDIVEGPMPADSPVFDFVCANLTLDVILPLLPQMLEGSRGTLVLSGILREQEPSISSALHAAGCTEFRIEYAGEWIAVIADRR